MHRKQWVAVAAVVAIVLAGPAALAAESVYHETASEFSAASRSTNLQVHGSGEDAKLVYNMPDLRETTSSEFQKGTLTNVSVVNTGDGAVAYDGLVVGTQRTTNSDFSGAKTLENVTVQNGNVELDSGTTLDSHEDGDIAEYGGDTGDFSTTNDFATDGSVGLNFTNATSGHSVIIDSGITAQQGDLIKSDWQLANTNGLAGIVIGAQSEAGSGSYNGYVIGYDKVNNRLFIDEVSSGSIANLKLKSATLSAGTTYTFEVDWQTDGTIAVDVLDSSGTVVAQISATDNSYTSGGLGYRSGKDIVYYDDFRKGTPVDRGVYEQNYSITNSEQAKVNLTLTNVSATVTATGVDGANTVLNQSTFSTDGNKTLTWSSYAGDTVEINVTYERTGSDAIAKTHDVSILLIEQAEYQSQDHRAPEATAAWADLNLPDTSNATVIVEGYDGSSWSILANTKFTSSGNKSLSIGSGYEQYHTIVRFNRSEGGANAELLDLGYEATKTGEYTGTNFTSLDNATDVFVAANISNADVTVTTQGYNTSTGTWETLNTTTFSSATFSDTNLTVNSYSTYRVKYSVAPNGSGPTANVSAIGLIAGGTVVKEVTETRADTTPFLLALSNSANTTAQVTISEIPIGAFPDYVQAQIQRQLKELFGFEEATSAPSEANQTQQFYNQHSSAFTKYINTRIAGDEVALKNYDTIAITWKLRNETTTKYWLGLRDGDGFATTTIENSTTREVDETLVLSGYAAVRSEEETKAAYESFVKPGKAPSAGYQATLKAQYGPDISGTLLNESTASGTV